MHGGTSTGPRSPEGLANSRQARLECIDYFWTSERKGSGCGDS